MDGPMISFDVSKGQSHVRAFESSSRALESEEGHLQERQEDRLAFPCIDTDVY